jgi:hypothetical protein
MFFAICQHTMGNEFPSPGSAGFLKLVSQVRHVFRGFAGPFAYIIIGACPINPVSNIFGFYGYGKMLISILDCGMEDQVSRQNDSGFERTSLTRMQIPHRNCQAFQKILFAFVPDPATAGIQGRIFQPHTYL